MAVAAELTSVVTISGETEASVSWSSEAMGTGGYGYVVVSAALER